MTARRRVLAVALAACLALTACGSNDDDSASPATRGPANVSGQSTCVYIDSPAECKDSGVPEERWFQAPTEQPQQRGGDGSSFLQDMFMFHILYSSWFSSPYYVDHYVPAPSRTTYVQHTTVFNNHYSQQIKTNQSRATYRTNSGKTVTGDKVNPKKFAPPKNNGGDRNKPCGFLVFELQAPPRPGGGGAKPANPKPANPKPPAPKPGAPKNGVGGDRGNGGKNQHGC